MKKCLLIVLFSFNIAFAQEKDYKKISGQVFTDIRSGEYSRVTPMFDSLLSARIDTAKLRQTWENLIKLAGNFVSVDSVSVDSVTTEKQERYLVVYQHCTFEKRGVDLRLVYGYNGEIKGISFLPPSPQEKYKLPSYANTELFTDRAVSIQHGPMRLPGILSTPKAKAKAPVVILIHGSGPNDKDETVGPTKIFRDIASGLASNGIAVYRYDKRTRVFANKMAKDKTITVKEETVDDAVSAIKLMKADSLVDSTSIYLCGHSMGGMLLPRIAEQVKGIKGLIYLSPNGRPLEDLLYEQAAYSLSLDSTGVNPREVLDSIRNEGKKIKALKTGSTDTTLIFRIPPAYWIDLNNYKPIETAASLEQPMLFIQGGRDFQVTETDFNIWKNGLKGKKATFKLYPDLNHFFIKGTGKSTPAEYSKSGNVAPEVIKDISDWIHSHSK